MGQVFIDDVRKQRAISVFVSSTFTDMADERELLIKRVFPQIRKECERRGIIWNEIDLRWGITEEEKDDRLVLPICFERIDECRPLFIGLLGDRYGWIPEESDIPDTFFSQYEWLKEHSGKSITELEFMHGVFRQKGNMPYSFFYMRSNQQLKTDKLLHDEPVESKQKLHNLKNKLSVLKGKGIVHLEEYCDLKEFESGVLADLNRMLDELFPEDVEEHPSIKEERDHYIFAKNRERVYIPSKENFEALNQYVESDLLTPYIIRGGSGLGKSALLANWGLQREAKKEDLTLMHFIGANPGSSNFLTFVQQLILRINYHYEVELPIPERPEEIRGKFYEAIQFVSSSNKFKKVIFIIDGLNQMENHYGAWELNWIPIGIASKVKFILSSLDGPIIDSCVQHGWQNNSLTVQPLNEKEREQLVIRFLDLYGKKLPDTQLKRIISNPQTKKPLFLRFVLEEIRIYGVHEKLDQQISLYLGAKSETDLIGLILERIENEYRDGRGNLVGDALSYLYCAKKGLSEKELMELLNETMRVWAPLFISLENFIIRRAGLLTFSHNYIWKAVERKYVDTTEKRNVYHTKIKDYFDKRSVSDRSVQEITWQMVQLKEWKLLSEFYLKDETFPFAWEQDAYEVVKNWSEIEKNSHITRRRSYLYPSRNSVQFTVRFLKACAQFFAATGGVQEALIFYKSIESRESEVEQAFCRYEIASLYLNQGNSELAVDYLRQAESYFQMKSHPKGLANCLRLRAKTEELYGNYQSAIMYIKEAIDLFTNIGLMTELTESLIVLAHLYSCIGSLDQAFNSIKDAKNQAEKLGKYDLYASAIYHQADILRIRGDREKAFLFLKKAKNILEPVGNSRQLINCLLVESYLYIDINQFELSLDLLTRIEKMAISIADRTLRLKIAHLISNIKTKTDDIYQEKKVREHRLTAMVNSNFREMVRERDTLIKDVFPRVYKICSERNIVFTDIDLNWGVTDQLNGTDLLLNYLNCIEKYSPVFISLVGETYGVIPNIDELPQKITDKYEWLLYYQGYSIDEIQLELGIFLNSEELPHSFFYLKNINGHLNSKAEGYNRRSLALRNYLLNQANQGHLYVTDYKEPDDLREKVFLQLLAHIESEFPSILSKQQQLLLSNEESILEYNRFYINRHEYEDHLSYFVSDQNCNVLKVTGGSGTGKTALLANWKSDWEHRNEQDIILMFNVDRSYRTVEELFITIVQLMELKLEKTIVFPDNIDSIHHRFHYLLMEASKNLNGKLILIIDQIESILDIEGFNELIQDFQIGANIKFILAGRYIRQSRGGREQVLLISQLAMSEKVLFIEQYLSLYGKMLSQTYINKIIKHSSTSNPLFLKSFLNEISNVSFYQLDSFINLYLSSMNLEELYTKIIHRILEEYDEFKTNIMDTLFYLYCSKDGLYEEELKSLLGSEISPNVWLSIRILLENLLIIQSGLLKLRDEYLISCIEREFIKEEKERNIRETLVSYFQSFESPRAKEEVSFQMNYFGRFQ